MDPRNALDLTAKGFAPPIPRSALDAWKRFESGTHVNFGGDVLAGVNEVDKKLSDARYEGGCHWRNGIYFKRLENGAVEIRHFVDWNYYANCVRWIIPAAEWAFIISSVSSQGETSEKNQDALKFHSGPPEAKAPVPAVPLAPPTGHNDFERLGNEKQ